MSAELNYNISEPPAPRTVGPQVPTDILELRAAEQRRRVHNAVAELRHTVRDQVDMRRYAREHVWPVTAVAAVFGLVMGYGMGGIFVR